MSCAREMHENQLIFTFIFLVLTDNGNLETRFIFSFLQVPCAAFYDCICSVI